MKVIISSNVCHNSKKTLLTEKKKEFLTSRYVMKEVIIEVRKWVNSQIIYLKRPK